MYLHVIFLYRQSHIQDVISVCIRRSFSCILKRDESGIKVSQSIVAKTNIAPENGWLEDYFHFRGGLSSGAFAVGFQGGYVYFLGRCLWISAESWKPPRWGILTILAQLFISTCRAFGITEFRSNDFPGRSKMITRWWVEFNPSLERLKHWKKNLPQFFLGRELKKSSEWLKTQAMDHRFKVWGKRC